jgi:hypothetical protein
VRPICSARPVATSFPSDPISRVIAITAMESSYRFLGMRCTTINALQRPQPHSVTIIAL